MTQSGHFLEQTLRAIGLVYTGGMTKHGKRLDRVLEKALKTPPKPDKTNKKKGVAFCQSNCGKSAFLRQSAIVPQFA